MAQENKFEVEITARIDQLEGALKKAEGSVKKAGEAAKTQKTNFAALGDSLSVLNVNFGGLGINVGAMVKQVQAVAQTIKGATLATRGFGMALAATGIGAIVLALGALFAAFKSTQEGTDAINKVMLKFKYAMDAIVGLLQGAALKAFDGLKKAFQDPKQAVLDLWNTIKTYLLDKMRHVADAFSALTVAIKKGFTGDIDGAKAAMKDFVDSALKANVVVDIFKRIGGAAVDAYGKMTAAMKQGVAVGEELYALDVQIRNYKMKTTVELGRQNRLYQENKLLAHDTTKSLEEQVKAQATAEAALERIRQIEVGLLQLELKRLQKTTETSDTLTETKLEIEEIKKRIEDVNAGHAAAGRFLQNNGKRLQEQTAETQKAKIQMEMLAAAMRIDTAPFEDFAKSMDALEDITPETFINKEDIEAQKAMLDGLAMKYNQVQMAAEMLSSAVGNIVHEGFDILFDSAKGFDDFAEVLKKSFRKIIADMAAAAAKALILRAIMGAFTGGAGIAIAGGGGIPSFGALMGQNLGFGGNMMIRGQDIMQVGNAATTNKIR